MSRAPKPVTRAELEDLLHKLGLHTWYQGDDGYGGEYELDRNCLDLMLSWFRDRNMLSE